MGAFDGPTNTKVEKHIFTANKGDYYDIADGMRRVDDQVQNDLVEFAGQAGDRDGARRTE